MENKNIPVVVIAGATASGKSKLALDLALKINGEIISADSMQIYKHLDIATAKPSKSEQALIKHHMIDIIEPTSEYSAFSYAKACKSVISEVHSRGKLPIIAGGTGLYISSVMNNTVFSPMGSDDDYRKQLLAIYKDKGNEYVHDLLKNIDPEAANNIHQNNINRVIRALEIYKVTGKTKTKMDEESLLSGSPFLPIYFILSPKREILYANIDKRVDSMVSNGLLDECKYAKSIHLSKTALAGIGYKEIFPYLDGLSTLEDCIDKLKQATRNYAKRQITWFKRIPATNLEPILTLKLLLT